MATSPQQPRKRAVRSDRGKMRRWFHPDLKCVRCDKQLTASNSNARYCSSACRQAAYRERRDSMGGDE